MDNSATDNSSNRDEDLPRFEAVPRSQVPKGRSGKHKKFIQELLIDLQQLEQNRALKIPLAALPDVKDSVRAALNRATRQRELDVATSSDAEFFYVWNLPTE